MFSSFASSERKRLGFFVVRKTSSGFGILREMFNPLTEAKRGSILGVTRYL